MIPKTRPCVNSFGDFYNIFTAENNSAPLVVIIEYTEETDKKKRNMDNPAND